MKTLISFKTVCYLLALGLHVVLDFLFEVRSGLHLSYGLGHLKQAFVYFQTMPRTLLLQLSFKKITSLEPLQV